MINIIIILISIILLLSVLFSNIYYLIIFIYFFLIIIYFKSNQILFFYTISQDSRILNSFKNSILWFTNLEFQIIEDSINDDKLIIYRNWKPIWMLNLKLIT